MPFVSPLEKRFFRLAAICLLLIYASLFFVRPVVNLLREQNLLRATVAATFLVAVGLVVAWRRRAGAGPAEWALVALFAIVYVILILRIRMPEERFHLIEYGLFGGLVYAGFQERREALTRAGRRPTWVPSSVLALMATVAAGWIDEGIQGLLPERVYDLRDVALNGVAGLVAVAFLAVLRRITGPGSGSPGAAEASP